MTYTGRYHSTCGACGGHISPGDEILLGTPDGTAHAACPDDAITPIDPPARTALCERCWTYHHGECA